MVNNKKAIIFTWERFQDHEVIYPYYALKEHNFDVTVFGNNIGRIYGDLGAHIKCDNIYSSLNNINVFNTFLQYDLLVIPGGVKALEKLRLENLAVMFLQQWNMQEKPILSICNGAQLLITADIIRDREISGYYSIKPDIENAGATYSSSPVVMHSNIVSCPHYDFMGEWMREGLEYFKKNYGL